MKLKKITAVILTSLTLTTATLSPSLLGQDHMPFLSITAEAVLTANTFADTQNGDFTLTKDKKYYSPNNQYCVIFQNDGNLVVYQCDAKKAPVKAVWNAGTYGNPGSRCVMQKDGNLVIYNSANSALWHTHTNGKTGARLSIMDDGELRIYSRLTQGYTWTNGYHGSVSQTSSGNSSSGVSIAAASVVVDAVKGTVELTPGKFYTPPNKQYVLVFQTDGNLVVYHYNSATNKAYDPVWNSGTHGNSGAKCYLQSDGNLVIYNSSMTALWNTHTNGKRRATLYIKDDGEISVVSLDANRTTWSNNYHGSYTVTTPPTTTTKPKTTTTTTKTAAKTTTKTTAKTTAPTSKTSAVKTVPSGTTTTTTTTVASTACYYPADASNPFGRLRYEGNTYRIVAREIDTSGYKLIKCTEQTKIDWDLLNLFTAGLDDGLLPSQSFGKEAGDVSMKFIPLAGLVNINNLLSSVATRYTVRFNFFQSKTSGERIVQIVGRDSNSSQLANSVYNFIQTSGYEQFEIPNTNYRVGDPDNSRTIKLRTKSTIEHHAHFGDRNKCFYDDVYDVEWYGDFYFWIDEKGNAMKTLRNFKGDSHSIYISGYNSNTKYIEPRYLTNEEGNRILQVDKKGDVSTEYGYRYTFHSSSTDGFSYSPATSTCMFGYAKADDTYRNLISLVQSSKKIK